MGIDYGAKKAGTTAICYQEGNRLFTSLSVKGADADDFCFQQIERLRPEFIMIDAPLSLPDAYFGKGDDFFYRQCDRELNAMSPMFLGGLTARAMRLADQLKSRQMLVYETYPRALASELFGLEAAQNTTTKIMSVVGFLADSGLDSRLEIT